MDQFHAMRAAPRTYYCLVIVDNASDRIVGVGCVFIERKFLRGFGSVGHIEDIAVDKSQQGKKLGLRIIQALTHISENSGCYKTILNCSDANIRESSSMLRRKRGAHVFYTAFYEKCGYAKKENEMVSVVVARWSDVVDFFFRPSTRRNAHTHPNCEHNLIRSLPHGLSAYIPILFSRWCTLHSRFLTILDIILSVSKYALNGIWFSVMVWARVAFAA